MITIYICPDCRCEHDEPAGADYTLEARCFDCTHLVTIAELRVAANARAMRRTASGRRAA